MAESRWVWRLASHVHGFHWCTTLCLMLTAIITFLFWPCKCRRCMMLLNPICIYIFYMHSLAASHFKLKGSSREKDFSRKTLSTAEFRFNGEWSHTKLAAEKTHELNGRCLDAVIYLQSSLHSLHMSTYSTYSTFSYMSTSSQLESPVILDLLRCIEWAELWKSLVRRIETLLALLY